MASSNAPNAAEDRSTLEIFFGLWAFAFVATPLYIMFVRLMTRAAHEGLSAMFSPPPFRGRKPLASRVRSWLFTRTPYGYYLDVAQAGCSAISCILFIVVSYAMYEPVWVTDIEVR